MPDSIPAKQYASGAITTYQRVKKLASENRVADDITFKWSAIDNTTASELREAIANIATNHDSPSKTHDPKVKEYLKNLFKSNMCSSVTVDYKKLNTIGIEGAEYASILRTSIQHVLDSNTGRLYTNMTMNHTV